MSLWVPIDSDWTLFDFDDYVDLESGHKMPYLCVRSFKPNGSFTQCRSMGGDVGIDYSTKIQK